MWSYEVEANATINIKYKRIASLIDPILKEKL